MRTNVQKLYRTNSKTLRSVRERDVAISWRPGFKDAQRERPDEVQLNNYNDEWSVVDRYRSNLNGYLA